MASLVFALIGIYLPKNDVFTVLLQRENQGDALGSSAVVLGQLGLGTVPSCSRCWRGACLGFVSSGGECLISGVLTVGFTCCAISTSFPSVTV